MEMTRDLYLAMLRQGNNGDQILKILNAITSSDNENETEVNDAEVQDTVEFQEVNLEDEVEVNEQEVVLA